MKQCSLISTPFLLATLLLCAHAADGAEPVGFNFMDPADNSQLGNFPLSEKLAPGDIAGVVPQTNWYNLTQGGTIIPPGKTNEPSGVVIEVFTTGGTHNLGYGDTTPDSLLMRGYLDTGDTGSDTEIVQKVPFPIYDVICYSKGDNGSATRVGEFTLTSTNNGALYTNITKYVQDNGGSVFDAFTYTEADSTNNYPNAAAGNYCRFYNIRGTNFTIQNSGSYGSDGHPRGPFNALQIVPFYVSLSNPSYNANGQFQCYLDGATNASYVIFASTNLVNWLPVSTNVAPAQITITPPANTPYTFYYALLK